MMSIPEELYSMTLAVSHQGCRHKIPSACVPADIAKRSLFLWRHDEKAAMRFAAMALVDPGQPEPVSSTCWRLIGLLECITSHHEQ